jgi:hypothetical protein
MDEIEAVLFINVLKSKINLDLSIIYKLNSAPQETRCIPMTHRAELGKVRIGR